MKKKQILQEGIILQEEIDNNEWLTIDEAKQETLEAIRQIQYEKGPSETFFVHCTLIPYIYGSNELKTKPTQNSVRDLRNYGIKCDGIVLRLPYASNNELKRNLINSNTNMTIFY